MSKHNNQLKVNSTKDKVLKWITIPLKVIFSICSILFLVWLGLLGLLGLMTGILLEAMTHYKVRNYLILFGIIGLILGMLFIGSIKFFIGFFIGIMFLFFMIHYKHSPASLMLNYIIEQLEESSGDKK